MIAVVPDIQHLRFNIHNSKDTKLIITLDPLISTYLVPEIGSHCSDVTLTCRFSRR